MYYINCCSNDTLANIAFSFHEKAVSTFTNQTKLGSVLLNTGKGILSLLDCQASPLLFRSFPEYLDPDMFQEGQPQANLLILVCRTCLHLQCLLSCCSPSTSGAPMPLITSTASHYLMLNTHQRHPANLDIGCRSRCTALNLDIIAKQGLYMKAKQRLPTSCRP